MLPADKAYAADDEYTYTITVNSGKEGTFAGGTTVKLGPYKYGEECKLELGKGKLELSINDPDTYRARGLKFSGHDNVEVSKRNYQSYSFKVKGDDEEVADELEDMYLNDKDIQDKLAQADPEKFKTSDPDELKEAFRDLGKKE